MAVAQLLQHPAHAAWRRRHLQRERNRPIRQRLEAKISAALEELEDLRQAFIDRLDALSTDPDLEDDGLLEDTGDAEPSLSATEALNQRFWSYGYCGGHNPDLEREHDGREPSMGRAEPQFGTPPPWLTDGGLGGDLEGS